MLVAPSESWAGTDGHIIRPGEARAYVASLGAALWPAKGVTVHNTAAPDGQQWDATEKSDDPVMDALQRAKNLTDYFWKQLGWTHGPHSFIADKLAVVFTPWTGRGTHASCFNYTHFGLEMVGDFDSEKFDSGRGAKVRDLTVEIVSALCERLSLDPTKDVNFHRDCSADQHACPGKNVGKADFLRRVADAMGGNQSHVIDGDLPVIPPVDTATIVGWLSPLNKSKLVEELQTVLQEVGLYSGTIDGWYGPKTKAAIKALNALTGG